MKGDALDVGDKADLRTDAATPDVILHHGERVLSEALDILRHLTPEGWEMFKAHAMRAGWHTSDLGIIGDARLLSMRYAPRFGDKRR